MPLMVSLISPSPPSLFLGRLLCVHIHMRVCVPLNQKQFTETKKQLKQRTTQHRPICLAYS